VPSLEPVGTIRAHEVVQATNPYYKLTRLAVLGEYRHHKFGGKLVLALHNWVKDDARRSGMIDFVKVVCHSQAVRSDSAGAVAFYRKYDVIIMFPEDSIWTHRCFSSLRFGYEEEVTMIPVRDPMSFVHNMSTYQGELFDEDGAPHQKMVARLSLS